MGLLSSTSALALPADRAYEMVTAPNKPAEYWTGYNGARFGVTPDGQHVIFGSLLPVVPNSSDFASIVRGDRGTTGWSTVEVGPNRIGDALDVMVPSAFSAADLSVMTATANRFDPADQDQQGDIYLFGADNSEQLLSEAEIPTSYTSKNFVAAAPDAHGVVFRNLDDPLLPVEVGHPQGRYQLYESRDGLRSIGLDTAGQRLTDGDVWLGGALPYTIAFNAYSRDGRRIYFTTVSSGSPTDQVGLWLRTDGTRTDPIPAAPAGANADSQYLGATPDGSKAFFATDLQLTADDTDSSEDLYEYDAVDQTVKRLSGGPVPADVQIDPVWVSDDGSRIYFTARGQLVPGLGSPGGDKTFLLDHGQLKFVANTRLMPPPSDYSSYGPQCGPTRATPDGRYLLAETTASLSPADQDGGAADVYRYDADTGQMTFVSTGPSDSNGPDGAHINPQARAFGLGSCDPGFDHVTHPMSDDGRYVFFETAQRLVPEDTNSVLDVYVWDAHTNSVSLISGGEGDHRADFLDATPDGSAVFFSTDASLLPSDQDSGVDVYSAKIGGGFPQPQPPAPACEGSDCHGAQAPPPSYGAPGTESFAGPVPPAGTHAAAARLVVRALRARDLRQLARRGVLRLRVVLGETGTVSVKASVAGKPAGSGSARGTAGRVRTVTVRLSRAGRRLLVRHGVLELVVHQARLDDVRVRVNVHVVGGAR